MVAAADLRERGIDSSSYHCHAVFARKIEQENGRIGENIISPDLLVSCLTLNRLVGLSRGTRGDAAGNAAGIGAAADLRERGVTATTRYSRA